MSLLFGPPPHLEEHEVERILNSMIGPRSRDRGGFTIEDAEIIRTTLIAHTREAGDEEGLSKKEIGQLNAQLQKLLPAEANGPLRRFVTLLLEALAKKSKKDVKKKAA